MPAAQVQAGVQSNSLGGLMVETKLDDLLKRKGKSLYWLQKESKISYTALLKLRKGRAHSITFDILEAICGLLECEPGDLLKVVKGKRNARTSAKKKN